MNTADLFVRSLENEGVEYIFGVPGEENLAFLEAVRKSKIKFVVTHNEQSAGFMAATFGRLTGNPGVALSTVGPGATNFTTAVAYAELGGMPALFITGQKPIKSSKQGRFQIVDNVNVFKSITKFSRQIIDAAYVPAITREAFKIAKEERPGAVHIELPEDIAFEKVSSDLSPLEVHQTRRPVAEEKAIKMALSMIESAKKPFILIGAGANRKRTSKILTDFIEKTGIPFFTTQMGKGVIDERHRQYVGTAALSENDYIHCAIDYADLIINIGHDTIEKPPFIMRKNGQKVIHINFFPAPIDPIYFPNLEVVGDIADSISLISEKIAISPDWNFDYFFRIKKYLDQHIEALGEKKSFPNRPQQIVDAIREVLKDDDIVTLDNGMYKIWFARSYETRTPNSLLLDNALATMGAGLPSAIAAKILNPDKRIITVIGDGGFLMNMSELETAKRLGLDLTIIIVNDSGFGMIKWKQQSMKLPDFSLSFSNPDYVTLAKSFHVRAYRVEKNTELGKILEETGKIKGIKIIEVPVDYSDNYKVLVEELRRKTCRL